MRAGALLSLPQPASDPLQTVEPTAGVCSNPSLALASLPSNIALAPHGRAGTVTASRRRWGTGPHPPPPGRALYFPRGTSPCPDPGLVGKPGPELLGGKQPRGAASLHLDGRFFQAPALCEQPPPTPGSPHISAPRRFKSHRGPPRSGLQMGHPGCLAPVPRPRTPPWRGLAAPLFHARPSGRPGGSARGPGWNKEGGEPGRRPLPPLPSFARGGCGAENKGTGRGRGRLVSRAGQSARPRPWAPEGARRAGRGPGPDAPSAPTCPLAFAGEAPAASSAVTSPRGALELWLPMVGVC